MGEMEQALRDQRTEPASRAGSRPWGLKRRPTESGWYFREAYHRSGCVWRAKVVASKTVEVSQLVDIAQRGMEVTFITHRAGQLTGITGFIFTASQ